MCKEDLKFNWWINWNISLIKYNFFILVVLKYYKRIVLSIFIFVSVWVDY